MATIFQNPAELKKAVGQHLGYSDWLEISQDRIDKFAEATGDHQWIHVDPERAKQGPFGACIAHGYLTQSLVNMFLPQIVEVRGISMVTRIVAWTPPFTCSALISSPPPRIRVPTGTGAGKRSLSAP